MNALKACLGLGICDSKIPRKWAREASGFFGKLHLYNNEMQRATDYVHGGYLKGTYIGLVREYKDEEALIQVFDEDPDHYYVQFDNRWLLYAYGWHKFPKSQWRLHE